MQATRAQRILIQAALTIVLLACATIAPIATPTPVGTSTPLPPSQTPTITPTSPPTITPTPSYAVKLGKVIKILSGGFSFSSLVDYKLESDNGGAYLESKDGKVTVYMGADAPLRGYSLARVVTEILDSLTKEFKDFKGGDRITVTQGDVESISVEFTATEKNKPIHGRFTLYGPPGSKQLYLIVIARGDQRWEREGQKVFDKIRSSIAFFPIVALEDCPVTRNPDYGTRTSRPIKVGGGLATGIQRSRDYLYALLGPKGEPIYFYREGSVESNGVTLDEYHLIWGISTIILYIDIYNYEELRAPTNLTCSVPFPTAPR